MVNADEMEPGTFKDRFLLEGNPHAVLEGTILAAYAVQAEVAYIFLRWAYKLAARAARKGDCRSVCTSHYLGRNIFGSSLHLELYLHVQHGRYMCGEETALLNALEGETGESSLEAAPSGAQRALGQANGRQQRRDGCERPAHRQLRCGMVQEPEPRLGGRDEAVRRQREGKAARPVGATPRDATPRDPGRAPRRYARRSEGLRGLLPGGASTDFLTPEHLDVPMDYDSVQKAGSRLGTGTMIVLDDRTCPVGMVRNLEEFFAQESCGWCTPCWAGLQWVADLAGDGRGARQARGPIGWQLPGCWGPAHILCARAGAAEPLQSALKYFRDDFERHIRDHRCPWR